MFWEIGEPAGFAPLDGTMLLAGLEDAARHRPRIAA